MGTSVIHFGDSAVIWAQRDTLWSGNPARGREEGHKTQKSCGFWEKSCFIRKILCIFFLVCENQV